MLCREDKENVFLVDYDSQKSVRVTQVASSNYLHAFALMKTHTNAVRKAHGFIAMLNNTDLSQAPIQVLKDLHNSPPEDREDFDDDTYRGFTAETQEYKVLAFSALNFKMMQFPELGNAEVPVIILGLVKKSDPTGGVTLMPILFHNGRWGFWKYWQ